MNNIDFPVSLKVVFCWDFIQYRFGKLLIKTFLGGHYYKIEFPHFKQVDFKGICLIKKFSRKHEIFVIPWEFQGKIKVNQCCRLVRFKLHKILNYPKLKTKKKKNIKI